MLDNLFVVSMDPAKHFQSVWVPLCALRRCVGVLTPRTSAQDLVCREVVKPGVLIQRGGEHADRPKGRDWELSHLGAQERA